MSIRLLGEMRNGYQRFEEPSVGSFTSTPPMHWSRTSSGASFFQFNATGFTSGIPINLDEDQYIIFETSAPGQNETISQSILGAVSVGEVLSLSTLIAPWDRGGPVDFGQASLLTGFSQTRLSQPHSVQL